MFIHNDFPNPEERIYVLKRYLHVLALIQNSKDPVDWNGSSLSEMLYSDETGTDISDKVIRDYIKDNLKKELGIDVNTVKGGRRTTLNQEIDPGLLPALVNMYSLFISTDVARDNIIKRHIKAHGAESLWILARIYFAAIQGYHISFNYESRSDKVKKNYKVKPYHIVFRGNNLYLACKNIDNNKTVLFIIPKIQPCSLKVHDVRFDTQLIPSVDELFSQSLGAFIGKKQKVVLRYTKNISHYITDIIDCVDPKIKKLSDSESYDFEASFEISDDLYLCKQLFTCGKQAEIISPPSMRKMMAEKLKECLGVYEG